MIIFPISNSVSRACDRHTWTSQMPEKIDVIINAPRPPNVSTLRAYLGIVNYYHRFLPTSQVLRPLNELFEKVKVWQWSKSCETAFLKSYGLGAVLSHVMTYNSEKPIAFASRSLSKVERNYSQIALV